ncbi:MAG: hypothetical protein IPN29_07090 [Saprospiraceae bacterium]|nr:hypothetical protein [Saprospiraceae bacterium]
MKFTFIKFFLAFGILLSGLNLSAQCGDADLNLAYSVSLMTPDSGQSITYTVVVNNAGPCTASDVDVRVSGQSAGFSYGMTGPGIHVILSSYPMIDLRWEGISISSGSSATLTYSVGSLYPPFPPTPPGYTSVAEVFSSVEPDPDSTPGNGNNGEDDAAAVTVTVFHTSCSAGNTLPAPPNVSIVNSTCSMCVPASGSITAPVVTPPYNYSLQYSVDGGAFTNTLPVYNQAGPPQMIQTRLTCNSWNSTNYTPSSAPVTTVPGTCSTPACTIGGDLNPCPNETGIVYSGPGGMAGYSWGITGAGTITSSTTGSSVTVTAGLTGMYTLSLTVTDGGGCTSNCNAIANIVSSFTTVNNGAYNDPNTWAFMCMPPNPLPPGAMVSIQSAVTNPPGNTLVNNGIIDLGPGGTFINYGIYTGTGELIGIMDNRGTIKPGQ